MSHLAFAPAATVCTPRDGGGFVLRSPYLLPELPANVGSKLRHWAEHTPERVFLAERVEAGWRRLTYSQVWTRVRSLGQAFLALGLSPTRPLLIVADNGIDHALCTLAGLHVGVPVAPVSIAYALTAGALPRLRSIVDVVAPGAVYIDDESRCDGAALGLDVPRFSSRNGARTIDELLDTKPGSEESRAAREVGLDHVGKILFTSGSTGAPRGIVNTQRMLVSNQEALATTWPFLRELVPNVVDWLPWSHTFGGNHNFFMVLWHGGTLTIDAGKPTSGPAFELTLANLREVKPNLYFNVPRGFDLLVSRLEADAELAREVLLGLEMVFYAAAPLAASTWQRLEKLVASVRSEPVAMVSAWGSTETTPLATQVHFAIDRAGVIGLPVAGTELAFVPSGDALEMRVKGPNVTPGLWQAGGAIVPIEKDEHGFWPTGDAGLLADDAAPERGVLFAGRLGENFKLASGTWVRVGQVRVALLTALAPYVADAVITGHDRDELGALLFLAPGQASDETTRSALQAALGHYADSRGSSERIVRALVLKEPPSLAHGEITDKGYINQRAVLSRRASLVAALYRGDPTVCLE